MTLLCRSTVACVGDARANAEDRWVWVQGFAATALASAEPRGAPAVGHVVAGGRQLVPRAGPLIPAQEHHEELAPARNLLILGRDPAPWILPPVPPAVRPKVMETIHTCKRCFTSGTVPPIHLLAHLIALAFLLLHEPELEHDLPDKAVHKLVGHTLVLAHDVPLLSTLNRCPCALLEKLLQACARDSRCIIRRSISPSIAGPWDTMLDLRLQTAVAIMRHPARKLALQGRP
mmetsp:Transcript_12443/g.34292  ORF Transcript_12443/g.34292 Transcript_12443/m.34292 type:complete len:232 (+) Transcript_12443:280-975(+)